MKQEVRVTSASEVPCEDIGAGNGVQKQVLIGNDVAPNFALRRFIMQPGGGMPLHTNTVEHEQYVLAGRATVGIGDKVYNVKAGDVVYIPSKVPHYYQTEGDEAFEFLCIVPNLPDKIEILDKGQL